MGLFDHLFKSKSPPAESVEAEAQTAEPAKRPEAPRSTPPQRADPSPFLHPKSFVPRGISPASSTKAGAHPGVRKPGAASSTPAADEIVLTLGDVLSRIPTHYLKAGLHDPKRELRFSVNDLSSDIARGRAAVPLSRIAQLLPDIFVQDIAAEEDTEVRLPLQKLVEQIGLLRPRPLGAGGGKTPRAASTPVLEPFTLPPLTPELMPEPATPLAETVETAAASRMPEPARETLRDLRSETVIEGLKSAESVAPPSAPGGGISFELRPLTSEALAPSPSVAPEDLTSNLPPSRSLDAPPAAVPPAARFQPAKLEPAEVSAPATAAPEEPAPRIVPTIDLPPEKRPDVMAGPPGEVSGGHDTASIPSVLPVSPAAVEAAALEPTEVEAGGEKIQLSLAALLRQCPREIIVGEMPHVPDSVRITLPFAPIDRQLVSGHVEVSAVRFVAALPFSYRKYFFARVGVKVPIPLEEVFQNLPSPANEPASEPASTEPPLQFLVPAGPGVALTPPPERGPTAASLAQTPDSVVEGEPPQPATPEEPAISEAVAEEVEASKPPPLDLPAFHHFMRPPPVVAVDSSEPLVATTAFSWEKPVESAPAMPEPPSAAPETTTPTSEGVSLSELAATTATLEKPAESVPAMTEPPSAAPEATAPTSEGISLSELAATTATLEKPAESAPAMPEPPSAAPEATTPTSEGVSSSELAATTASSEKPAESIPPEPEPPPAAPASAAPSNEAVGSPEPVNEPANAPIEANAIPPQVASQPNQSTGKPSTSAPDLDRPLGQSDATPNVSERPVEPMENASAPPEEPASASVFAEANLIIQPPQMIRPFIVLPPPILGFTPSPVTEEVAFELTKQAPENEQVADELTERTETEGLMPEPAPTVEAPGPATDLPARDLPAEMEVPASEPPTVHHVITIDFTGALISDALLGSTGDRPREAPDTTSAKPISAEAATSAPMAANLPALAPSAVELGDIPTQVRPAEAPPGAITFLAKPEPHGSVETEPSPAAEPATESSSAPDSAAEAEPSPLLAIPKILLQAFTPEVIPPPALPLRRFDQDALQAIFMTDEALDLPKISRLAAQLPGVHACVIATRDQACTGGALPEGFDLAALLGLAPRVGEAAGRLPIGELKHFTLYGERYSVSFFERNGLSLCAVHRPRSFVPGVREKLVAIADELSR